MGSNAAGDTAERPRAAVRATPGGLAAACATAGTVAGLADVTVEWLERAGFALPSIYLMIAGRLRCVGVRGYWQILEGLSLDQGILAKTFRAGVPQLVADVRNEPDYIAALPGVVSEYCVPVRFRGAVVGLLNVESQRHLATRDVAEIDGVAEIFEHGLEELGGPEPESPWQRLAWRAAAMSELTEPDDICAFAVEAACEATGLDSALLVVRRDGVYSIRASTGALSAPLRVLSNEVLGRIASWTASATSAYTYGAATGSGFWGHEELREAGVRALASATLPSNGGRHGFLLAAGQRTVELDYARLQHLEILAAHTSSALHTAVALDALRDKAAQDSLTGLGHGATFHADLATHVATSTDATAVLLIDLDNFKAVNDTKGHGEGDRVLVESAALLQRNLRAGDRLYRIGGDEFAAIVAVKDGADAAAVASHLTEAARRSGTTRISVGVTVLAAGEVRDTDAVLAEADLALYTTKESGRDGVTLYRPELSAAARERAQLIAELPSALVDNELSLVYQPVVDLAEGYEVLGVEALVRWNNPRRGQVPPLEFIPLAEQHGLISPVGRWVLRTACEQLAQWQGQGWCRSDLRMAVNVSASELTSEYVDFVAATLVRCNVRADQLVLEVTESVFIDDSDAVCQLTRLRELGVHVAVDDFGTGYSSLSYLHRLPIDILKLDRSFVGELGDPRIFAVAQAIVQLARTLGLSLVAEGVEESGQVGHLRRLGCEHGQGYLWSRPLSADELRKAHNAADRAATLNT